jgi:hypothetical protein
MAQGTGALSVERLFNLKISPGSHEFFKSVRWNIINLNSACGYVPKCIFRAPNPVLMKQLLLALLLVSFASSSALADSPEAILKDYRKQALQAVERVNQSLEKAGTPLITKLVSSGDTAGAEELTAQLKAKVAGEPVATPQASATQLFALYDDARAKALLPVQKSSVARIDSLLKTAGGAKLEIVAELGKVRAEVETGKVSTVPLDFAKKLYKTKWTWGYEINSGNSTLTFGAGKTLQINTDTTHKWEEVGPLKIKWDDESIMTFGADLKTFQVDMAKGGVRRGKLIDADRR